VLPLCSNPHRILTNCLRGGLRLSFLRRFARSSETWKDSGVFFITLVKPCFLVVLPALLGQSGLSTSAMHSRFSPLVPEGASRHASIQMLVFRGKAQSQHGLHPPVGFAQTLRVVRVIWRPLFRFEPPSSYGARPYSSPFPIELSPLRQSLQFQCRSEQPFTLPFLCLPVSMSDPPHRASVLPPPMHAVSGV